MSVFSKVAAVQAELARVGISKEQTNTFDKYKFRGIDDVYGALSSILASKHLVIIPQVQGFASEHVQTSGGKPAIHTHVTVKYLIADGEGETTTACVVIGEAQDRGDKGMNKAMSSAYKLMAFQMFCIPVEGESIDSESESIEVAVQTLGDKEIVEIQGLMGKANLSMENFLSWQGMDSIESIPMDRYARIISALNRKLDQMSQEYAAEQAATNLSETGGAS